MIEIEPHFKRGFVYGEASKQSLNNTKNLKYKIEKVETIQNIQIWTIEIIEFEPCKSSLDLLEISQLKCKHGEPFKHKTVHRLPQEGWQELIDCWSCHDHEFRSMLDLKMSPRIGGILVSNFYLIAHSDVIPECCRDDVKLFYDQISCSLSMNYFIYKFFEEYFAMKSTIVLLIEDKKYEIKLFYECNLIKETAAQAFKVGFRESTKQNDADEFIGEYFKKRIFDQLIQNSIGLNLLGYRLSFITLH